MAFKDFFSNLMRGLSEAGEFGSEWLMQKSYRDDQKKRQSLQDSVTKARMKDEGYDYNPEDSEAVKESRKLGIPDNPFRAGDFVKSRPSESEAHRTEGRMREESRDLGTRQSIAKLLAGTRLAGQENEIFDLERASPGTVTRLLGDVLAPKETKPTMSVAGRRALLKDRAKGLSDQDVMGMSEGTFNQLVGVEQGTRRDYERFPPGYGTGGGESTKDPVADRLKEQLRVADSDLANVKSNPMYFTPPAFGLPGQYTPEGERRINELQRLRQQVSETYTRHLNGQKATPTSGGDTHSEKAQERRRIQSRISTMDANDPRVRQARDVFRARWNEEL